MTNKSSTRVALGGVSAALCLTVMLSTALMPFATYALPALAGILLLPIALELGIKTALVCYLAVSILSMLIVPDIEAALMFAAFFGYYPILKIKLDAIKFRLPRVMLKFLAFNAAIIAAYMAIIYLFGLTALLEEFSGGFGWLLLIIGNIFFPLYELALINVNRLYSFRIRKIIFKGLK